MDDDDNSPTNPPPQGNRIIILVYKCVLYSQDCTYIIYIIIIASPAVCTWFISMIHIFRNIFGISESR